MSHIKQACKHFENVSPKPYALNVYFLLQLVYAYLLGFCDSPWQKAAQAASLTLFLEFFPSQC